MNWFALTPEELIAHIRADPAASERDLILVEHLATFIDELAAVEAKLDAERKERRGIHP